MGFHFFYKSFHMAFSLSLMVSLFSACSTDLKKIDKLLDRSVLNTERAENVTILYSKNGHTSAKLFTKKFSHNQAANPSYIEMTNGLKVDFYDDSLQVTSTLTAKYGKFFEKNGNVLVRDSVIITNNKLECLQTEELVWNETLKKFFTEKFVKITTPTQIIYGDGLESDQSFSQYKIINIKGVVGVQKGSIPLP